MSMSTVAPRRVDVAAPARDKPRADAFERVYRDTYRLVCHVIRAWYGITGPDAEDLVQEVYLNFYRRQRYIGRPQPWLIAAACNIGRKYRRELRDVPESDEFLAALLDQDPEDAAERVSRAVDASRAFAQLPPKCRKALTAIYSGATYREMSATWHTSEEVLRNLVYRCVRKAVDAFKGKVNAHVDAS